jgi:hypothetical protein
LPSLFDGPFLHNREEHHRAEGTGSTLELDPGSFLPGPLVLFPVVYGEIPGGSRLREGKTMSNDRMTVPDFLGELDAGVFMNKIAAALIPPRSAF